jgi:hypothetical protein
MRHWLTWFVGCVKKQLKGDAIQNGYNELSVVWIMLGSSYIFGKLLVLIFVGLKKNQFSCW